MKETWRDEWKLRVSASLLTALFMLVFSVVLLKVPVSPLPAMREQGLSAMRLEFLQRQPPAETARPVPPAPAEQPIVKAPVKSPSQTRAEKPAVTSKTSTPAVAQKPASAQPAPAKTLVVTTPTKAPAANESIANAIYTRQGEAKLPPGVAEPPPSLPPGTPPGMPSERDKAMAKNVLEKPNPIHYEKTRFDKDWASSGTLGQLAGQKVSRAMKDLFKGHRTEAIARPPPTENFNPALVQNQADLGSEATGDAYKAAPISFEKAPQPPGEASKAIRAKLDELQGRALMCKDPQKSKWLGDVRKNLTDLERNETALTHGADVQRAEHYLPQAIDAAYDLARRALWYADKRLSSCGK